MFFFWDKFGNHPPAGTVIKNRAPTGEIIAVDAPNRDAIVSRVIWLPGMERQNLAAHDRCIYIHGTPEERRVGRAASFGCIRMRSRDVIALYDRVHIGMHVTISEKAIDELLPQEKPTLLSCADYLAANMQRARCPLAPTAKMALLQYGLREFLW